MRTSWQRGYDAYWDYPEMVPDLSSPREFRMGWWAAYDDDHDWGVWYAY